MIRRVARLVTIVLLAGQLPAAAVATPPVLRAERDRAAVFMAPGKPAEKEAIREIDQLRAETEQRLERIEGEISSVAAELSRFTSFWNQRLGGLSAAVPLLAACMILALGAFAAVLIAIWQRIRVIERHPVFRLMPVETVAPPVPDKAPAPRDREKQFA